MAATKRCILWGSSCACLFLVALTLITFDRRCFTTLSHSPEIIAPSTNDKMSYFSINKLQQVTNSLDFINTGSGYCKDIIDPYNKTHPGIYEEFVKFLSELQEYNKGVEQASQKTKTKKAEKLEGYSAQLSSSLQVYWRLARLSFVNTICETGFNAGHSSFLWLTANPKARVYSFDIGTHKYAKKMAAYLQDAFPGRLNVTWGDSTKTIPIFRSNHSHVKCDLLIIDGGHSVKVAVADFENFYHLASDLHVVLMDDHPAMQAGWSKGPRAAWEGGKLTGKLHEIAGCTMENLKRGIVFGFFL